MGVIFTWRKEDSEYRTNVSKDILTLMPVLMFDLSPGWQDDKLCME